MIFLYLFIAYWVVLLTFIIVNLVKANPQRTLAKDQNKLRGTGISFEEKSDTEHYFILHAVEDGIERITYTPKIRKHEAPILMLHGMWHGAWCWEPWQKYFAENGWEVITFSLPGHGKSTKKRTIFLCRLDYYLAFLRDEVARLPQKPILMGHSMGGALTQWYLKYLGDDLPAAVLVAPWVAKNSYADGAPLLIKLDPIGALLTFIRWNTSSYVRSPKRAALLLTTEGALVTPEDLHAQLTNESALVTFQHMPPLWYPPKGLHTSMLILAAEKDAVVSLKGLKASAEHYGAELLPISNSGHNLMMEATAPETVKKIDNWLKKQEII